MNLWSIIGIGILLVVLWKFFRELGRSFPVLEFLLLIAGLQWIIGPINSYGSSVQHYKYYMYVDEVTYMSYVVPAFLFFAIAVLSRKKIKFQFDEINFEQFTVYGKPILFLGVIADIAGSFAPPSLAFFLFLLAQFKFIGAGLLLFSPSRKDRFIFYAAIGYLFIRSLDSAMFHDLLLWGAFFFMLWALKYKPDFKKKMVIFLGAFVLITGIQLVKGAFRQQVWDGYQGNKLSLLMNVLSEELNTSDLSSDAEQEELNVRLNQGWIISAIMKEVPEEQPYADGETVKDAISASLLPRFLAPGKTIAGGRENFQKYTGVELGRNTSMGMSIIGEAYANFGGFGGIVFMLGWGFLLVLYWNKLLDFSKNHPLLIFFIPLLFLQVVKAETELVVVLNHLVKASIVVFLFFWFAKRTLKWEI